MAMGEIEGKGNAREREEGRGKREEGRGKREEGRGKREEGRGKRKEEGGVRMRDHCASASRPGASRARATQRTGHGCGLLGVALPWVTVFFYLFTSLPTLPSFPHNKV
jgi:hypothetical protein